MIIHILKGYTCYVSFHKPNVSHTPKNKSNELIKLNLDQQKKESSSACDQTAISVLPLSYFSLCRKCPAEISAAEETKYYTAVCFSSIPSLKLLPIHPIVFLTPTSASESQYFLCIGLRHRICVIKHIFYCLNVQYIRQWTAQITP